MRDERLLRGVRRRGNGFQVRTRLGGKRIEETYATPEAANARKLELAAARQAGIAPEMIIKSSVAEVTLAGACDALLVRKTGAISLKTGRKLVKESIEWWERILKPWRTGKYAAVPVSMLRRTRIEDDILERAAKHPKAAGDELFGLKAVLRYAGQRGAAFDPAILLIEPVARSTRTRHALTAEQLKFFVSYAPDYAWRMLLFKGLVGNRVNELFTLTDDRLDLDERWLLIPWFLCKEKKDKYIDLTPEEVQLLREQLLARAPGTDLVFPSRTGLGFGRSKSKYGDWHRMVWSKTVSRASAAWRTQHGLGDGAPTPFVFQLVNEDTGQPVYDDEGNPVLDALEPHDLRATAATLMRDAGFTKEQAAARLGHADAGELLDRIYDRGDRRARAGVRDAIANLPGNGLLGLLPNSGRHEQSSQAAASEAGDAS